MTVHKCNIADALTGIVLAALGVWVVFEASRWNYLAPDGPGPGFFPFWYGLLLFALAAVLIARSFWRRVAERVAPDWRGARRALCAWVALAAAISLLEWLGFLLAFALLTLFIVGVLYRRPLAAAVAASVLTPLGFHLIFAVALNVALPVGRLGF